MSYLLGAAAAIICFIINRLLFKWIGYRTIIGWSPLAEEIFKSLPAYYLNFSIFPVHVVFGIIEGSYESINCRRNRYLPALLSVIGHSLFGLTAVTVLFLSGNIWLAVSGAVILHLLWNIIVVRFF